MQDSLVVILFAVCQGRSCRVSRIQFRQAAEDIAGFHLLVRAPDLLQSKLAYFPTPLAHHDQELIEVPHHCLLDTLSDNGNASLQVGNQLQAAEGRNSLPCLRDSSQRVIVLVFLQVCVDVYKDVQQSLNIINSRRRVFGKKLTPEMC